MTSYPWTTIAAAYDRTLPYWGQYRSVIAAVARTLECARRVLDAGCGTGIIAERLAASGHIVHGVDQSPEMIALAQRRVPHFPDHLRFLQQDASELCYPDATYDGVVSTNVFFAVKKPIRYLAELRRVLQVGGRLVITGPTPRAPMHVEDLVRDFRDELEHAGMANLLAREIEVVIKTNRMMARHGIGRTCAADEMAFHLATIGFQIDDCHEHLYRNTLFFVAATKVSA